MLFHDHRPSPESQFVVSAYISFAYLASYRAARVCAQQAMDAMRDQNPKTVYPSDLRGLGLLPPRTLVSHPARYRTTFLPMHPVEGLGLLVSTW